MANILIVHAHPEPQSFSTSLARTAAATLATAGHQVVFSDLYAQRFDPVSDRRNFTTTADPAYLKQQVEEAHATEHAGFVPELDAEMRKVEACDLLIFSFPLWWYGMPAILKGWVDRVLAYGRMYGEGRWFETGFARDKRAMVLMTTGGGAAGYGGHGFNPSLEAILTPIHHGIFWFNGMSPLPPFVAWSAAHGTDSDRHAVLAQWQTRLAGIFAEPPYQLPPTTDFDPETALDTVPRFMVTLTRTRPVDAPYHSLIPAQIAALEALRRDGLLLSAHTAPWDAADWHGFLLFRAPTAAAVTALCQTLPLHNDLTVQIIPL
ncbi:MAG: oxidoreductase [Akkermansiaceae bacterium]|nr:oxidoreductase [Akkermansiaceae bacterium]